MGCDHMCFSLCMVEWGLPCWLRGKESACNAGDAGSVPGPGRSPGEREWLPTPVFWPGEFHEQRSLVVCGPLGCKELYMTDRLRLS